MAKLINFLTLSLLALLHISCLKINNKNETSDSRIKTERTQPQEAGFGHIHSLGLHVISCPAGSALAMFHQLRVSDNSINYEKSCLAHPGITNDVIELSTTPDIIDNNPKSSINTLDRHHVKCPEGRALQYFKLERSGRELIYYKYKCVKINSGSCVDELTPWSDMGNRENFWLDRQVVTPSKPGYLLTEFKLISKYSEGGKIRYNTRSCQVVDPKTQKNPESQNVSVYDFTN
jgi:hypothetical protein